MIIKKASIFEDKIDEIEENFSKGEDVSDDILKNQKKLKSLGQSGLDKGGEFSYENLVQILRRNGYIGKLLDIQTKTTDKKLSSYNNKRYFFLDIVVFIE